MNGKGSKPRPFSIKYQQYAENWDVIFSKEKEKKPLTSNERELKLPKNLKN
jgi:hypothetical protein